MLRCRSSQCTASPPGASTRSSFSRRATRCSVPRSQRRSSEEAPLRDVSDRAPHAVREQRGLKGQRRYPSSHVGHVSERRLLVRRCLCFPPVPVENPEPPLGSPSCKISSSAAAAADGAATPLPRHRVWEPQRRCDAFEIPSWAKGCKLEPELLRIVLSCMLLD